MAPEIKALADPDSAFKQKHYRKHLVNKYEEDPTEDNKKMLESSLGKSIEGLTLKQILDQLDRDFSDKIPHGKEAGFPADMYALGQSILLSLRLASIRDKELEKVAISLLQTNPKDRDSIDAIVQFLSS